MPNPIPILMPYHKKRKFQKNVQKATKERESELETFKEKGFENKDSYKTFLEQRDKSRANVYASAKKLKSVQKSGEEAIKEATKNFGEDSLEADFARIATATQFEVSKQAFQNTLKNESQKLDAVTPSSLKQGKSSAKAVAVGAGVGAAVGVGAFVGLQFLSGGNLPNAPKIVMPKELELPVTNPYEPKISVQEVETNPAYKDVTVEEVEKALKDILKSKEYQTEINKMASNTNSKIDAVMNQLVNSYDDIEVFANNTQITEQVITGGKGRLGAVFGVQRGDENIVTYCVKVLQQIDAYQEKEGHVFVQDYIQSFPNIVAYLRSCNVELTTENLLGYPREVSVGEMRRLMKIDQEQTGVNWDEFLNRDEYRDLNNSYFYEELMNSYVDSFKSQLSSDQLQQFENVLDKSQGLFDTYVDTVGNYNTAISELQQKYLHEALFDGYVDDVVTNAILGNDFGDNNSQNLDQDGAVDEILNHFNSQSESKVSEILDAVSDDAVDAVSNILDDTLSM